MTTIDHQQAAVRAIADALHGDACPVDPDPGESCGCGDYEREAEIALAAAAPIIRAQALRDFRRGFGREFALQDPYGHFDQTTMSACHRQIERLLDEAARIAERSGE